MVVILDYTVSESVFATTISGLVVAFTLGTFHGIKKFFCKINDRSLRQSHAFLILAQEIDRLHVKDNTHLFKVIDKTLRNNNGEL